jgi:16S rRNA (guanine527-N7)-methyltransferase
LQGKPPALLAADVGSGAGLQGKPPALLAADVGSGAGLPGIPLAIALPDADFTLIERMGRRANFLRNTLAVLGLPNARVEEADMERAPGERFNLAVFRAFRPLEPRVLRALFRLLRPGGVLAAYKGRRAAIMEELAKAEDTSNPARLEILPCPVPFLAEERHLLCLGVCGASRNSMEKTR